MYFMLPNCACDILHYVDKVPGLNRATKATTLHELVSLQSIRRFARRDLFVACHPIHIANEVQASSIDETIKAAC